MGSYDFLGINMYTSTYAVPEDQGTFFTFMMLIRCRVSMFHPLNLICESMLNWYVHVSGIDEVSYFNDGDFTTYQDKTWYG